MFPGTWKVYLQNIRILLHGFGVGAYLLLGNRKVIGWRRWLKNGKYLLSPWQSPYIRWRMHTVFATNESELTRSSFIQTIWSNRNQLWIWICWHREMKEAKNG